MKWINHYGEDWYVDDTGKQLGQISGSNYRGWFAYAAQSNTTIGHIGSSVINDPQQKTFMRIVASQYDEITEQWVDVLVSQPEPRT